MIAERRDTSLGIPDYKHVHPGVEAEPHPAIGAIEPQQRATNRVVAAVIGKRSPESPDALQPTQLASSDRRIEQGGADHGIRRPPPSIIPIGHELSDHRSSFAEADEVDLASVAGHTGQIGVECRSGIVEQHGLTRRRSARAAIDPSVVEVAHRAIIEPHVLDEIGKCRRTVGLPVAGDEHHHRPRVER